MRFGGRLPRTICSEPLLPTTTVIAPLWAMKCPKNLPHRYGRALITSDKCLGLVEALGEFFSEAA